MSYNISTLVTRNLHEGFGENDPTRRVVAIGEIVTRRLRVLRPHGRRLPGRRRDRSNRGRGQGYTPPDFRYQPIAEPEEVGNGGRVQWVRAALVRCQHTLVLISSLPGTAGLPPFIFFSTSSNSSRASTL